MPKASSAGKLQITTKSSKKERLPKFVGSGNFLLLSCSPRLHSHPLFLLLSSPLPVISLSAMRTLPQELLCSCSASLLSPQTSSPSVVPFQPASGTSCVISSLFSSHCSLLHIEAQATPMLTPHSHGCTLPWLLLSPVWPSLGF